MDLKTNLTEKLSIVEPAEKVKLTPWSIIIITGLFVLYSLFFHFVFGVLLTMVNVLIVMPDQLANRIQIMIELLGALIYVVAVQLHTEFGGDALEIVGLSLIMVLIILIWAGLLTRKSVSMALQTSIFLLVIFVIAGDTCELYLVFASGPSKLKNKLLCVLGCEFIAFDLLIATGVAVKLLKLTEAANFIGLCIQKTPLIWNVFGALHIFVNASVSTFVDGGGSHFKNLHHVVLTITSAICVCIILSIIASTLPSFTDLDSIFIRDIYIHTVYLSFLDIVAITSQAIGTTVVHATKCPAAYAATVRKITVLSTFITILCVCKYFKVTPKYLADLWSRLWSMISSRLCFCIPPPPPPPVEPVTHLIDENCESQSSNQIDEKSNNITAHVISWELTGITAVTGTSRENASYTLLLDSEGGEISINTCEMGRSRTVCI